MNRLFNIFLIVCTFVTTLFIQVESLIKLLQTGDYLDGLNNRMKIIEIMDRFPSILDIIKIFIHMSI